MVTNVSKWMAGGVLALAAAVSAYAFSGDRPASAAGDAGATCCGEDCPPCCGDECPICCGAGGCDASGH